MDKFPIDAPKEKVIKTLELLGFRLVKEREHLGFERRNSDGTATSLSCPNHKKIKGSTLRTICTRARISRDDFMKAYEQS